MSTEKNVYPVDQKPANKKGATDISSFGSSELLNTNKISKESSGQLQVIRQFLSSLTVEPVFLLVTFGFSVIAIVSQNLYIDRICQVKLNQSAELCFNLTRNIKSDQITDDLVVQVYGLTSRFHVYNEIINSVVPIIYVFFLGSWTDKHGNKLPFLLCICGYLVADGLFLLISSLPDLPPEYLLLCTLPISLTGSGAAMSLTAFSYISSVTTPQNRSLRMALLQGCVILGAPAGLLIGAKIYKSKGFLGVYLTGGGAFLFALIYGIIFIRDKKSKLGDSCCSDMINIAAVKETFATVFKRRDNHTRIFIFMLISVMCFRIMAQLGPSTCLFLFMRYSFGWNEQNYSLFITMECVSAMIGVVIMSSIGIKYFKLEDSLVGLISTLGFIAGNLVVAFAPSGHSYSWLMYVVAAFQMFGGMVYIVTRSMISKIVPEEEVGKIFAFIGLAETAIPIFGGIMYSSIFVRTEKSFPGAFGLLSVGFDLLVVITLSLFFLIGRKNLNAFKNES